MACKDQRETVTRLVNVAVACLRVLFSCCWFSSHRQREATSYMATNSTILGLARQTNQVRAVGKARFGVVISHGFKGFFYLFFIYSFLPLVGARKQSYIRTRHSL